jgi:hypothetical protein
MKKNVFVLFLLVSLSIYTFAADFSLSAGGGGLLGYTFTRYTLTGGGAESTQSMDRINYAGFLFFDAAYGEFSILIQGGNNTYSEDMLYTANSLADSRGTGSETSLGFSLMGKYPFVINEKLSGFPLLGLEYQIALIERRRPDGEAEYNRAKGKGIAPADMDKNGNSYPLSAWNSLWINVGGGIDYTITGRFFLRGELFFGFRLPTTYELGALEVVKKQFDIDNPALGGLTGSPTLKICIGYRL